MALSDYVSSISGWLMEHADIVIVGIIVLSIFTLIAFIILNFKLASISQKYKQLMTGVDGKNLEDLLTYYSSRVKDSEIKIQELQHLIQQLEEESKLAVKKVYTKRYDAFGEMGGDLSFSLALLNDHNSGLIITSIFGRDENRIYLKPVESGKSKYTLSPEEKDILSKAIQG